MFKKGIRLLIWDYANRKVNLFGIINVLMLKTMSSREIVKLRN